MDTKITKVNPNDVIFSKINARYMKPTEYNQLVENIRRDGKLTSVPLCYRNQTGDVEVISGNHRIRAASDAGLVEVDVMLCLDVLSKDQILALQLSHNAIVGKDDEGILRQLYEMIEDVDWKTYAGLCDVLLDQHENAISLQAPPLNFQMLMLAFLPDEIAQLKQTFNQIEQFLKGNPSILANYTEYDAFMTMLNDVSLANRVTNTASAFWAMLRLAEANIHQLKDMCFERSARMNYVPLRVIMGRADVPQNEAAVIDKAIQRLIDNKSIPAKERHKALAYLAEFYLNA